MTRLHVDELYASDPHTEREISRSFPLPVSPVGKAVNITSKTSTLVVTGRGVLHAIVVNNKGSGSNTCKIYDGTDAGGTLLGTILTDDKLGAIPYGIRFTVGLFILTEVGTQADLTVVYAD